MPPLDPKDRASFGAVETVIKRITSQWRSQGHIMDIVPALKTRGGVVQPETLAIGFHVAEKLPQDELTRRGLAAIPAEIDGIPTDVILARQRPLGSVDTKSTRSQMFDTLIGGIAVGNANMNAYGTLAMVLLAESDGRMVGLTNEHVLVFDGDGHVGDEVQQPRFYLNSEVSLDNAACCPNGTLHYRGVDNPIVDASAAVFAATALAAALSDVIDPHRRGQDATVPAAGERTLKETVSVDMNYPEMPLPGRPYKLDVNWKYQRHTDQRTMDFGAAEVMMNPHVIQTQSLTTDQPTYTRGATVTFLARLGRELEGKSCDNYFVTAAALSPSRRTAYKLILRPVASGAGLAVAGATRGCLYRGQLVLAPNEELGRWGTYLFAQTRNDVPLGTPATTAARTIGGLPVTHNFVDGGPTDSIIYGHRCNIDLVQDGSFEVVAAPILT
jgi:hypothetical protein